MPERAYTGTEGCLGGLDVRTQRFAKKGDVVEIHAHGFDHLAIVIRGPLRCMWTDLENSEQDRIMEDGERLMIRRDTWHGFKALADNCLSYCIAVHADVVRAGRSQL